MLSVVISLDDYNNSGFQVTLRMLYAVVLNIQPRLKINKQIHLISMQIAFF